MEHFAKELSIIKDVDIRNWIKECITLLPEYYFTMPASTTGKYHPQYSLGEGGLYRHVQGAVKIAQAVASIEQYGHINLDLVVGALILHDGWKKGLVSENETYTKFTHPLYPRKVLKDTIAETTTLLWHHQMEIFDMIDTHMGEWNTNRYDTTVLPKPTTEHQKFVHLCDYLASRKFLTVEGLK